MHTFNSTDEKLQFLIKYKLLSSSTTQIPNFYYFNSTMSSPALCDIVGYEDTFSNWSVITVSVSNKNINIHSNYLKDMQKESASYFKHSNKMEVL